MKKDYGIEWVKKPETIDDVCRFMSSNIDTEIKIFKRLEKSIRGIKTSRYVLVGVGLYLFFGTVGTIAKKLDELDTRLKRIEPPVTLVEEETEE